MYAYWYIWDIISNTIICIWFTNDQKLAKDDVPVVVDAKEATSVAPITEYIAIFVVFSVAELESWLFWCDAYGIL